MDLTKVDATLDQVDKTVGALIPLVGTIGGIARLFIGMAKKQGLDTTTFEAEIAKFDAQSADLHSAVAEFRAKYPKTALPADTSAPAAAADASGLGPAPGQSTTIGE